MPRSAPAEKTATYLDTDAAVEAWLASIRRANVLALDTEGASFHRFIDRIYLIQLSTRDQHAIIDPLPISAPRLLGDIVEDPQVEIVFHDADYDLRLLHQDYGWQIRNVFDTRIAAQLLGIKAFGLAALLERNFGIKLDKKHQRADWSMRPLTVDMLDYAAQDTMNLLGLRDQLREELVTKGRLEWAMEEFARLESTRWTVDESGNGFLKVKGARDLTRRELAIFKELVLWRDATALKLDRATFRVVSNEVLFDAARTAPSTKSELGKLKGMPRGILERSGEEMLAAIQRGREVPEADLPRFPKAARWDRDPEFDHKVGALKSVRDAAAERLELDPGVLCSRDRMEAVARLLPQSPDDLGEIPEFRQWQVGVLGEGFVKALGPWKPASPYRD
ncbi:MAG TPA: HRDC domain-containing protein [Vicinamibacterales bacterium]|nr:HRDC domain-containing protein [Vicinamibacterales bacterium]